jgi:hypothetical protein
VVINNTNPITQVDFYAGAQNLGTSSGVYCGITWNNVPQGSFALKAVATDTLGLSCTSNPVRITIVAAPTNIACQVNGTNLTVSWPVSHLGWTLMTQTNRLSEGLSLNLSDWSRIPGSQTNTQVTTSPGNMVGFYRLVYP